MYDITMTLFIPGLMSQLMSQVGKVYVCDVLDRFFILGNQPQWRWGGGRYKMDKNDLADFASQSDNDMKNMQPSTLMVLVE